MKRTLLSAALLLTVFLAWSGDAFAFRCGNRLVSFGDAAWDVAAKCGDPSWVDSRQENHVEYVYTAPYLPGGATSGARVPVATIVQVNIEEWTYNMGPSQFIRVLRFENSRLVDIMTGGYGY